MKPVTHTQKQRIFKKLRCRKMLTKQRDLSILVAIIFINQSNWPLKKKKKDAKKIDILVIICKKMQGLSIVSKITTDLCNHHEK